MLVAGCRRRALDTRLTISRSRLAFVRGPSESRLESLEVPSRVSRGPVPRLSGAGSGGTHHQWVGDAEYGGQQRRHAAEHFFRDVLKRTQAESAR